MDSANGPTVGGGHPLSMTNAEVHVENLKQKNEKDKVDIADLLEMYDDEDDLIEEDEDEDFLSGNVYKDESQEEDDDQEDFDEDDQMKPLINHVSIPMTKLNGHAKVYQHYEDEIEGKTNSNQNGKIPNGGSAVPFSPQHTPAATHQHYPKRYHQQMPSSSAIDPSSSRMVQIPYDSLSIQRNSSNRSSAHSLEDGQLHPSRNPSSSTKYLRYPREIYKTLAAAAFTAAAFLLTAVSLAFVHETRPLIPPLPDQVLDRLAYRSSALYGSEILIQIQTFTAGVIVVFHRHRFIVLRRILFLMGILYVYRAVTMWVTALPPPDPNYPCAPKFGRALTVAELTRRVLMIIGGFGLSINGKHIFCGDNIYSGHTMMIILGHLVISEYTPARFVILHWITWLNAILAVALLMFSRGHYSIDVILAYYFATRLWSVYHTLAGHPSLRHYSDVNHISSYWWFKVFLFFESNVKPGRLPNEFSWPFSFLRRLFVRLTSSAAVAVQDQTESVRIRENLGGIVSKTREKQAESPVFELNYVRSPDHVFERIQLAQSCRDSIYEICSFK